MIDKVFLSQRILNLGKVKQVGSKVPGASELVETRHDGKGRPVFFFIRTNKNKEVLYKVADIFRRESLTIEMPNWIFTRRYFRINLILQPGIEWLKEIFITWIGCHFYFVCVCSKVCKRK